MHPLKNDSTLNTSLFYSSNMPKITCIFTSTKKPCQKFKNQKCRSQHVATSFRFPKISLILFHLKLYGNSSQIYEHVLSHHSVTKKQQ